MQPARQLRAQDRLGFRFRLQSHAGHGKDRSHFSRAEFFRYSDCKLVMAMLMCNVFCMRVCISMRIRSNTNIYSIMKYEILLYKLCQTLWVG